MSTDRTGNQRGADGPDAALSPPDHVFLDPAEPTSALFYRWVQPPQMAFLVSTMDPYGNANLTPATLGTCLAVPAGGAAGGGYFFGFSVGCEDAPELASRQGFLNLERSGECVIAYPGADLLERIRIAALPFPSGISEFDMARLTPLASRRVAAPGVAECGVNLEAQVRWTRNLGSHFRFYLVEVVGVSVQRRFEELDAATDFRTGARLLDPLFEIGIGPSGRARQRMFFATLDAQEPRAEPEAPGPEQVWIGTFEEWMDDEVARERLDPAGKNRLLELARAWEADPRPDSNADVRRELTRALEQLVWEPR